MTPSYAVITICRNAANTVGRAVNSVFAQNPRPKCYVFVDGQSTDGTPDVIETTLRAVDTGDTDCQILTQIPQPRRAGIPSAWNQGLEKVRQDIVFILNADDWYEPHAAERVLRAFAAGKPDIVVAPIQYRLDTRTPVQAVQRPRSLRLLPWLMPVPHPGCFVKRAVYDAIGRFDERYAVSADYDFIYRAYRAGMSVDALEMPLVNMQPGGFARQRLKQARRETRQIACRHGAVPILPWIAFFIRTLVNR